MTLSQENAELRRILAILVNNKKGSPEYKLAIQSAIDILCSKPADLEKKNKGRFEQIWAEWKHDCNDTI